MQGIYHIGKLGTGKRVVLVCRNLNLLENKATVNLSVPFIKLYAILSFLFVLMICLNNQAE